MSATIKDQIKDKENISYRREGVLAVDILGTGGKLISGEAVDSLTELLLLLCQTGNVGIVRRARVVADGGGTETVQALSDYVLSCKGSRVLELENQEG